MKIERRDTERDGQLTEAAMRRKLEMRGYAATRYVYPPGTCLSSHTHDEDKIDAVGSRRFRITLGGQGHRLEAGDLLAVPRGAIHDAALEGNTEVVSLDAVRTR